MKQLAVRENNDNLDLNKIDAQKLQLLRVAGATVEQKPRPPLIWWSHQPAGWCAGDEGIGYVDEKVWRRATINSRTVWFAESIVVVIVAARQYWLVQRDDGTFERVQSYTDGARKSVQYAALVRGMEAAVGGFCVISTSRVTKSKELFADLQEHQRQLDKLFQFPAPLWTMWFRLAALRDERGNVAYRRLPQGAVIAPPRVVEAGWTRQENWPAYKAVQDEALTWVGEVMPTQVVHVEVVGDSSSLDDEVY